MNISLIILAITLFVFLSHHLYRDAHRSSSISLSSRLLYSSLPPPSTPPPLPPPPPPPPPPTLPLPLSLSTVQDSSPKPISTVSILIPDWRLLVIASPETPPPPAENYTCVFPNNASSPARFAGVLPFSRRTTFTCEFPERNRRRLPFLQPSLVSQNKIPQIDSDEKITEVLKWNFLSYEAFTTENDVVLLVKGVNTHQGISRPPSDFRCIFGDNQLTAVRTSVTSSAQEVFRCSRPQGIDSPHPIIVTLEILQNNTTVLVPSVAYYTPRVRRTIDFSEPTALTCACTMVYNIGKFLKEWVTYHASIGIGKFILYDNDSDDDLAGSVQELNRAGFDVRTVYWPWPKTQEAGFSHCAVYSEQICHWMAFLDVDEFVISPTWLDLSRPASGLIKDSLLPKGSDPGRVGQVSIKCNVFGPSNQTGNPVGGVTQGYTCRRRGEQRHKSIVLVVAIHPSLLNVVHHFQLRKGYKSGQIGRHRAVVNHYKYQAWPEFRAKFRRRVSAYVLDWRSRLNLNSNDRAPGLGSEPVEPIGWAQRFCEVRDDRLKVLTRRWFGLNSSAMAWQNA